MDVDAADAPRSRPKRTAKPPAAFDPSAAETASKKRKRSPKPPKSAQDIADDLLRNPKSRLTTMDMRSVINAHTWSALSSDSRAILATMLPPTALPFFVAEPDETHPAHARTPSTSANAPLVPDLEIDSSFLTCPFFEAAMRTFQDHIFSGYFAREHEQELNAYEQGLRDGTLHAAWKDDAWEHDHPAAEEKRPILAEVSLTELARAGVLREGDTLVHANGKGATVREVHRRTSALIVSLQGDTDEISLTTVAQLERAVTGPTKSEASDPWTGFAVHRGGSSIGTLLDLKLGYRT